MKSITFYYSPVHQPGATPIQLTDKTIVWIRAEVKPMHALDAYDAANPYLGETMLHAVHHPESES